VVPLTDSPDDDFAARLYVTEPLGPADMAVRLDAAQVHYLKHVLRLGAGDAIALFNGRDGEWRGVIDRLGKQDGTIRAERQTRQQPVEPDIWLCFAPVKRARIDYIAEKATELGISALIPVFTRRTNVTRVNLDRLGANAREAAEQTERLSVPEIREPVSLDRMLERFPKDRILLLCDETGTAPPIADQLNRLAGHAGGWAVMIGPEGGFAPDELDALRKLPFVNAVSLGPRVLRADTAALAALAVFQALRGDWRNPPESV
jgi:16S rRNA (uracil1498-N3)-methyltransferase